MGHNILWRLPLTFSTPQVTWERQNIIIHCSSQTHHEVRVSDNIVGTVTVVRREQVLVKSWRLSE